MNFSGRLIGSTLVAIAVAWILNIAGVFPFNNSSNNQLTGEGGGGNASNANNPQNPTGTQNLRAGAQGNGSIAQQPTTTSQPATGSDGTVPANPSAVQETPVVRGAW